MKAKEPRLYDPEYLKYLRKLPCSCGCRAPAPSDAAHIRAGSLHYNKRQAGLGEKPHDRWAVPLNRSCHIRQHAFGSELEWWSAHGIGDPFHLCQWFYVAYGGAGGVARKRRTVKPRRPKEQRKAIKSRGFQKGGKQKIKSRGFR